MGTKLREQVRTLVSDRAFAAAAAWKLDYNMGTMDRAVTGSHQIGWTGSDRIPVIGGRDDDCNPETN
jgi:hypothetical protein